MPFFFGFTPPTIFVPYSMACSIIKANHQKRSLTPVAFVVRLQQVDKGTCLLTVEGASLASEALADYFSRLVHKDCRLTGLHKRQL